MKMLYVWHYELVSRQGLNARSRRTLHPGALIRVNDGFGCIHPWPELGDLPLAQELASLTAGKPGPLATAALACAKADGAARRANKSLFLGPVPESHWLALPGDTPSEAMAGGFSKVKFKLGPDFAETIARARDWVDVGFSLRFDANGSLTLQSCWAFWAALGPLREHVELIEDPIPWDPKAWLLLRQAGIPLAVDRNAETRFSMGDIAVIKPALSHWIPPEPAPFFLTSAMDHAVGQLWAAAEAARHAVGAEAHRLLTCGLATHRCFENDPFFEQIRCEQARLIRPPGTGLGFDQLLEDLPWKRLI